MYPNFSSKNNDHLIFVATKSLLTDAKVIYIYIYSRAAKPVEIWKELPGKSYMLAGNKSAASHIKSNNMLQIARNYKMDYTNFLAQSRWSNTWPCDTTVMPT